MEKVGVTTIWNLRITPRGLTPMPVWADTAGGTLERAGGGWFWSPARS